MTLRRRRTLPPVSPKTPPELKPLIAAMTEIMEVGEGVRGDPLDTKITWRDILDSGIGRLRDGMRPGDGALINPALPPAPDLSTPPAPAGFTAQGSFYGMINLSWQIPGQQYRIHAATNIYRSEVDNFANAEIIAREAGAFYTDYVRDDAIDPDDPTQLKGYYYWITFTSVHDVEGPPNDTAGTYAAPIADVGYVMELITERIDKDVLATELRQEIDSIIPIRDSLLEDMGVIESRIDDEILRLNGIRDGLLADRDETRARLDAEILRLNEIRDGLYADRDETRAQIDAEIVRLNDIRDDLVAKTDAVDARVDAEVLRLDGVRDAAYARLDTVEQDIQGEIERLSDVEDALLGPDTVDGTVANRIADERAARIAALDGERDERIVAIQYEADARVDAIQAEAEARGQQFLSIQTQIENENGLVTSQLDAIAAAYDTNVATIYTLEEVRITNKEATATRINGLEVEVEDNKASLIEEQTVRASETSALSSQISVLSAKLDALPTFANGFEAGVEFGRWTVPSGHTLVAESTDSFQGDQAALIGSTEASVATGTVPFGVSIALSTGTGDAFAGRRLRIGLAAKAVSGGSVEYAVGYATSDGWFSGWQMQTPQSLWAVQEALVDVPDTPGLDHYIVLWGDTSGGGGTVKIDRLLVEVANTEIPEITAQIENIQQSLVDTEQALTEDITNMQSVYDTQIADIQDTQTTLSTDALALAEDIQTLTATTGDLTADIQEESRVRADENEALAQSVTDLWAGVGDAEGRITQEAETRAQDGYFRGLLQDVMQASVETSAATITSIKEVVVEKDSVMARNVEGIEGRVADAEGAVTDIMQLNIDPGSVLATRFSSIEGSVAEAEGKITNIENLDIAEDSVLASRLSTIDGKVEDAESKITAIETLDVTSDSVLVSTMTSLDGRVEDAEGGIKDIANLDLTSDTLAGSKLSELSGSVDNAHGAITDIVTLDITSDTVSGTNLSDMVGSVADAHGAVESIVNLDVTSDLVKGSSLEQLVGDVGDAKGTITDILNMEIGEDKALLTRFTDLEGRVDDAEGNITSASELQVENERISGLISDVITASTGVSTAAYRSITDVVVEKDRVVSSRLVELTGEVGDANGRITNLENLDISPDSALLSKLTTLEGSIGDAHGAISDLDTVLVTGDNSVVTRLSEAEAAVDDAAGAIQDIVNLEVDATSVLAERFSTIEGDVEGASGAINDIVSLNLELGSAILTRFNDLDSSVGDASGRITGIENLDIGPDSALLSKLTTLEGSIGDAQGAINDLDTVLVTGDNAVVTRLSEAEAAVEDAAGAIQDIVNLEVDPTSVLAERFSTIDGKVGDAEGAINDIVSLNLDPESAVLTRLSELDAGVGEASGRITGIENLTLDETSALVSKLNTLEADVGDASGEITNIKTLNLTEDDALLTELNRLSGSLGDAEADIKNIANIELSDGSTIAQQFNTIDAALGALETNYTNIVDLSIDETSALGQRFESLGTAETFVYDLMDMNLDRVGGRQLVQRLIGVENETSKVQLKAASYSGAVVQNGSFVTGDLTNWGGWSGVGVVQKDENSNAAVRTMPSQYAARFLNTEFATSQSLVSEASPVSGGDTYTFQFSHACLGGTHDVQMVVRWASLGGDLSAEEVLRVTSNSASWGTTSVAQATAPSDATEARVVVRRVSGGSGFLYITDIRANAVGEAVGSLFTAKVEENGLIGGFGVFNDGEIVDAGFDVDRFWVGRTDTNAAGYRVKPFIIDDGTVYIDTVMIRDASIQEGQIGPISIGKFFFENPITGIKEPVTTVGGLIRADSIDVDNLSVAEAARFYGNVQSGNYIPGEAGWLINQAGNVEFNEGTFNGTVEFNNVTGAGALASRNNVTLAHVTDAGTLAGKNSLKITEILNAGALASKNSVDYETEVTNKQIIKLGTNPYHNNDKADAYSAEHKNAAQLLFTCSANSGWPTAGGCVTYWQYSNRARQVVYSNGDGKEWVRETHPGIYPDWTTWTKKEIFSSSDVQILDTTGAGQLAAKDSVAISEVLNAGSLATKDKVDYDSDLDNRPFVRLGTNAYTAGNWANYYDLEHKVGELIFTVSTAAGWPTTGGVITYWYASDRATQVCFATGSGDEWVRRTNPTDYPHWSGWTKKEIFSSSDVQILQTSGAGALAGKDSLDISEVLNAGALASKSNIDYEKDVANKPDIPIVKLGTNAYSSNAKADTYDASHKKGQLLFDLNSSDWPEPHGGVVTYWYSNNRATQVCFGNGGDREHVRDLRPANYPNWSNWVKREVFSSSDVNALQTINGPAQAGADVTGSNTAADTSRVAGTSSSTVRDRANAGNAANNRVNHWTKPDKTTIDGNKITTGFAYVDTLEIKGRAITVPASFYSGGDVTLAPQDIEQWVDLQSGTFDPEGGACEIKMSALLAIVSYVNGPVQVQFRLLRDSDIIYNRVVTRIGASSSLWTVVTPIISHGPLSGAINYTLQIRYAENAASVTARNRYLGFLSTKR